MSTWATLPHDALGAIIHPDESVSAATFDAGAGEVARNLVQSVMTNFRR